MPSTLQKLSRWHVPIYLSTTWQPLVCHASISRELAMNPIASVLPYQHAGQVLWDRPHFSAGYGPPSTFLKDTRHQKPACCVLIFPTSSPPGSCKVAEEEGTHRDNHVVCNTYEKSLEMFKRVKPWETPDNDSKDCSKFTLPDQMNTRGICPFLQLPTSKDPQPFSHCPGADLPST